MNADGIVTYDGVVFRAGYQRTPSHAAMRLGPHETENAAIAAIEERARIDGLGVTIRAGKYPRGTRAHNSVITRS